MSDEKQNTAVRVAIIAGLFTLCGTIITVVGGPLVTSSLEDSDQDVTKPTAGSSSDTEESDGDKEESPTFASINLPYMENESGWVTQVGQIGTGADHPPQAGDFNNNAVVRGFLSFDLTRIPNNVTINSAELIFPETAIGSGDVFPEFGALKFEALWYGLSLNAEAFDTPEYMLLQDAYGRTSVIGVAAAVEEALQQGYQRFQIRFSFSVGTDNDGDGEVFWVPDGPFLEVEYIKP